MAMNENLLERFSRWGRASKQLRGEQDRREAAASLPRSRLNRNVKEYFDKAELPVDSGPWLSRPEFPSTSEVLDTERASSSSSNVVEIAPNVLKGAWESKEAYLGAHYELLREDTIRPLREAVSRVRFTPAGKEDVFNGAIGIYDKVHICGLICSRRGIAIRVTFSLFQTGKKIIWEQSKRLISGNLVVLTPKSDTFTKKAIVATVAARPLVGLNQKTPEIDLFIARAEELEIDPAEEFVMIEARSGMYEGSRHTLLALQRMMREPFPLAEHLVDVQPAVTAPQYVEESSIRDMTSVFTNNKHETYAEVETLNNWPTQPASDMDRSQLDALRRILTKRLALVQGPPGTGKTYVTVEAVKVLLANRKADDPPIVIASQTNHAVDQILRLIAEVEADFVRLGGRSKDRDKIKARTLYEVRRQTSDNSMAGSAGPAARRQMKQVETEIKELLSPLSANKKPLDLRRLVRNGTFTTEQAMSLERGASQWVQDQAIGSEDEPSPFFVWLDKSLIAVPPKQEEKDYGFDYEEADLEFEQLQELEAENIAKDDEDYESLVGNTYSIADNFTCRKGDGTSEEMVKEALKEQDMWKIPQRTRPAVYRYLQAELKTAILTELRQKTKAFNEQAKLRGIGNWEQDETILKKQKIIGMTKSGLSKYRGLIAALKPKIILIEEAAEILEAPVAVACLPSLEHLILVGDHQQLRPHCHVRELENKPFYLNVSLFERLVRNKIEYSVLSKQRRMTPEIRRILQPIYGNLIEDHKSVLDPKKRPDVPGMGDVNSFFFTHEWPEQRDELMSAYNSEEAHMVAEFVQYLVYNDVPTENITILTFYHGQRKKIFKQLREMAPLKGRKFKVVTVDSYQGEENEIVLLSLVRSNNKGQIGFLDNPNRVCVALSRARCGLYIFGNGGLLYQNKLWEQVITIMANQGKKKEDRLQVEPKRRIAEKLTFVCRNHNNKTEITDPADFAKICGGCAMVKCDGSLPCGHPCGLTCHPFPHDIIQCHQPCQERLPCGHDCKRPCYAECFCDACAKRSGKDVPEVEAKGTFRKNAWGSEDYDGAGESSEEEEFAGPLVDLEEEEETEALQQLSGGGDGATSTTQSIASTELIEERSVAGGTRVWYKETFRYGTSEASGASKEDWSKKESLLD